jgi:anti-anti-sigma factor
MTARSWGDTPDEQRLVARSTLSAPSCVAPDPGSYIDRRLGSKTVSETGHLECDDALGVVTLSGQIDAPNAGELRRCLQRFTEGSLLVLNLRSVDSIDPAALRELAEAARRGVRLSVWNASPVVAAAITEGGVARLVGEREQPFLSEPSDLEAAAQP